MKDLKIALKSKNGHCVNLELCMKNDDDLISDYNSEILDDCVYNDLPYSFVVSDEDDNLVQVDSAFVNNERLDDSVVNGKYDFIFLECFGVVKLEIIFCGISYVTKNLSVMLKKDSINTSVLNMIDYIYDNCDDYLYEEHKNSKKQFGITDSRDISIDSRLSRLKSIYETYIKCFEVLRFSPHTKLVNQERIGDFSELYTVQPNTIRYIISNPAQLKPVNYNSGISYNKQYYQPNKTLVKAVEYSNDTYENQVVVGFIKTLISDLREMLASVEKTRRRTMSPKEENGYVESVYFIYTKNNKVLSEYVDNIEKLIVSFQ